MGKILTLFGQNQILMEQFSAEVQQEIDRFMAYIEAKTLMNQSLSKPYVK